MEDVNGTGEALQFDRAEYEGREGETDAAAPAVPCSQCGRSIADSYYKVNYAIACRECYARALVARGAGSGGGRFLRALSFGAVAGGVGFALYYGVLALTGYEFGLIAIVVGFLVGMAVQIGSYRRGGWLYQTLAMVITYVAIVTTYVPFAIEEIKKGFADVPETSAPQPEGAPDEATAEELGAPEMVLVVVFAFVLAFVAPFMAGLENVLGLVIIGIGLYEAWKLNQRQPFETEGPFQVGAQPA